jgi:hypothetical protein
MGWFSFASLRVLLIRPPQGRPRRAYDKDSSLFYDLDRDPVCRLRHHKSPVAGAVRLSARGPSPWWRERVVVCGRKRDQVGSAIERFSTRCASAQPPIHGSEDQTISRLPSYAPIRGTER